MSQSLIGLISLKLCNTCTLVKCASSDNKPTFEMRQTAYNLQQLWPTFDLLMSTIEKRFLLPRHQSVEIEPSVPNCYN